jgi:hypothetical protein
MRSLALVLLGLALAAACSTTAGRGPGSPSSPSGSTAASFARAQPATPAAGATAGTISGRLGYPSEFLPPLAIYAISTDGRHFYRVQSVTWQQHYTLLGVAPGDYFVLTTTGFLPGQSAASDARTEPVRRFGAAYTKAVPCGLSFECADHSLLPVHVSSGIGTSNIDPDDWYADPGTYPFMPEREPPTLNIAAPPATFDTVEAAAIFLAQSKTGGRYVKAPDACPINAACVWLTSSHEGQAAAYYLGAAGSNGDVQNCAFYVVGGTGAWRTLESRCAGLGSLFPAVGANARVTLGMGEQGCVNVHDAPGISSRVVACLGDGTVVQIDNGPDYIASQDSASARDLWWHIAGKGWMVDQYLGFKY